MKHRRIFHTAAVLATSLAAFGPNTIAKGVKESKKLRSSIERPGRQNPNATAGPEPPPQRQNLVSIDPEKKVAPAPARPRPLESTITVPTHHQPSSAPAAASGIEKPEDWIVPSGGKYPWKTKIVTTTFWIGEDVAPNNPVANVASSWDPIWSKNYGGIDSPKRDQRCGFLPAEFIPQQNPFYVALPYNDITSKGHKPEAANIIPWFNEDYKGEGKTVLKDRWVAIRFKGRVVYAQWEDCGPFRTDHSAYVFGTERPKPNLNKGAGLDVSPAVRDYLGMNDTDVTDWRFVDFDEVPPGPWSLHGENNTFGLQQRAKEQPVVLNRTVEPGGT